MNYYIKRGNKFPFDAPDSWWEGDKSIDITPKDEAHAKARAVIAELEGRSGGDHFLSTDLDEDIRQEIVESLAEILREDISMEELK